MRKIVAVLALVLISFYSSYFAGTIRKQAVGTFHDMLITHPHELTGLITPGDKRVSTLATELRTPENAYVHVRDRIRNDPSVPALTAGEIITEGRASCLGKAALLCSLYRAMGAPPSSVRVVTGDALAPGGIFDHAWVEMEYKGECLQQDATGIFGSLAFGQFKGNAYTQANIQDEEFVFNDKNFAVVSALNQLKGMKGHPAVQ